MYKIDLEKDEVQLYVAGLNHYVINICMEIKNSQNPAIILKQALSILISINAQLSKLDIIIDQTDKEEAKQKALKDIYVTVSSNEKE